MSTSLSVAGRRTIWAPAIVLGVFAAAVRLRVLADVDHGLLHAVASWRTPTLDAVARAVTFFGSSPWTLGAAAALSLWWWGHGRRRLVPVLWASWAVGLLLQVALRFAVSQERPDGAVIPMTSDFVARYEAAGFPSGHAFRAAFLFGWCLVSLRAVRAPWARPAALGCWTLIAAVGLTRVYLGRHWPTDVLGAWLLAAWALAAAQSWRRLAAEA